MNLKKLTRVDRIVIHCAATRPDQDIGARDIDAWHRRRGFVKIGYHYVIRRNGEIETGRAEDEVGAHAQGFNSTSIGICLAGGIDASGKSKDNFTAEQWESLSKLVADLKTRYPNADVLGHRDLPNVAKDCPCFDVRRWWSSMN